MQRINHPPTPGSYFRHKQTAMEMFWDIMQFKGPPPEHAAIFKRLHDLIVAGDWVRALCEAVYHDHYYEPAPPEQEWIAGEPHAPWGEFVSPPYQEPIPETDGQQPPKDFESDTDLEQPCGWDKD